MEKENLEKVEETAIVEAENNYQVMGFDGLGRQTNTRTQVITNISDSKKIFNLENKVDAMINDCEGEMIRVKDVLIKRYEKPLENPIINEETGEIEKEYDLSMSCVIVDDIGKSYATGSKTFTIQLMRYLQLKARNNDTAETFDIKIIKKKVGQNGNKALSFELV